MVFKNEGKCFKVASSVLDRKHKFLLDLRNCLQHLVMFVELGSFTMPPHITYLPYKKNPLKMFWT